MPREQEPEESFCYSCDETFLLDDLYTSEHDHELRCDGCNNEHYEQYEEESPQDYNGIFDYSYTPELNFWNDAGMASSRARRSPAGWLSDNSLWVSAVKTNPVLTDLYLGPEIEVECTNGSIRTGADWVYKQAGDNAVYLKHDGSLSHGFEIVGHPGTLGYYMNHFNWDAITGLSDLGFKSWNRRSCGLHLHMSRSAFTGPKHLFKFFYLMYKNSPQMIKFAGRESNYASWDIRSFLNRQGWYDESVTVQGNSMMDMAKAKSQNDNRYCAINVRNRATIELRFFRPSLRPETVQAAIQMADAAFRYTAGVSTVDVMKNNALAFDSFKAWVNEGEFKDRYAVLAQRISERVIG